MKKRDRMHRLVLLLDDGLWSHLKASLAVHLTGNIEDGAIYMLRQAAVADLENANVRRGVVPRLPRRYRKHWRRS
jgi:hypothetical protein